MFIKATIYIVILIISLFSSLIASVSTQTTTFFEATPTWTFIDATSIKYNINNIYTFRFPLANEHGNLIGYRGFNITLGYNRLNYFRPVRTLNFNPYWTWGTNFLVIPYVGWGTDYYFSRHVYVGGGITLILPFIHLGVNF